MFPPRFLTSAGLVVGPLQKRYPTRQIMLVGSILAWAGVFTSGFATSTQWLILSMGVIHSIGYGTISVTMKYFAMVYFDRLRGIAMGITLLGMTIAGFIFPKVLLYLRDTYGFQNCLFLLGAFSVNITPLVYLLREPPWCKLRKQCKSTPSIRSLSSACVTEQGDYPRERQLITSSVIKSLPEPSRGISSMARTPIFHLVVLSSAVSSTLEVLFLSSMADFCRDRGLTTTDAVWLTSSFSLANLLGRLFIPLFSDRGLLRRSSLLVVLLLLMAAVMMSAPCATTYWSLAAVVASGSILVGSGTVVNDVLVVDYFGLEILSTVYGIIGVVKAPLQLSDSLILGKSTTKKK
ncbi:unnamed protein product [Ixodes hexagonus]